ncbi:MAG TPA: hypothetical protein VGM50_23010 [Gemmatimonadaceae bacterium]|jgi:hypothetical protein
MSSAASSDISAFGISLEMDGDDAVNQQLDAVGDRGDKAAKRITSAFSATERDIIASAQQIATQFGGQIDNVVGSLSHIEQALARQAQAADHVTSSLSRMSAATVTFRRQTDDVAASTTRMTAPAVTFNKQADAMGNAFTKMTAPAVTFRREVEESHGSFGRLNQELVSAITNTTNLSPAVSQLSYALGSHFVEDSMKMITVLGAIAAGFVVVTKTWEAWHVEANTAKDKQKELTQSLIDWNQAQKNNGTGDMQRELVAAYNSAKQLREELQKIGNGQASGVGVALGAAPGGLFSSITRILTAGNIDQVVTQFGLELGKGTSQIVATLDKTDDALHGARKTIADKLTLDVSLSTNELNKQNALNDAYLYSANYLQKLSLQYDAIAQKKQNDANNSTEQAAALNKLVDQLTAAKIRALDLADAQQQLRDSMADMNAKSDQIFQSIRNLVPELHEQTEWFRMMASALQGLTPQLTQTSVAYRAMAESAKYLSQNTTGLQSQVVAFGVRNTAGATAGLNASAAKAQRQILEDAQATADAIQRSVGLAVDLTAAFGGVDKNLGSIIDDITGLATGIGPLIEQIKALGRPNGMGGSLGSITGVLGAVTPVIGAITGVISVFHSMGDAAREQKIAMQALKQSIDDTTASIQNQLGVLSDAQYKNLQLEQERIAQDDKIRAQLTADAGVGGFGGAGKAALEAAIAAAIAANDAQFKSLEALNLATEQATKAETALAEIRKNASAQDNYQLRFLNAAGKSDDAFALQQQQEIEQAMVDGLDAISMRLLEQAQAAEKAQREQEKQTTLLQDQLSTAQQTYDTAQQTYSSLKAFSDSLAVSQYSPLSPRQQLDTSRSQLSTLYQAAIGGDSSAAQQFSGVAQTYLDASRKYNASGAGYVLDYNSVTVMTDALKNLYGSQMTDAQKQVSLLQQQLDELKAIDISTGILAMRPALTPTTPTPTPVGGTRPRIDGGAAVVDAIVELRTELNDRIDSLVAVSQAGFVGTIAATQENTSAVEDSATTTRRALDSVTAAVRSA